MNAQKPWKNLPLACSLAFLLAACTDGADELGSFQDATLRMNEIQVLGTHNSYHIQPLDSVLEVLASFVPDIALDIEYTHLPLAEQLDRGVRQMELDLYADPDGGLYAIRRGLSVVGEDPEPDLPELREPGFKVMHIQEIDFETHCLTFVICLTQLKEWSDANPTHLPITIMIDGKTAAIPDPLDLGFVVPLPIGAAEVDAIDAEILSVFDRAQLIVPDDVRGNQPTLNQAVTTTGWPTLADARGRFLFVFLNGGETKAAYLDGRPSLEGRVMFANSTEGEPHAAWFNINRATTDGERIRDLVAQGYLIRTRADANTRDARAGDYTLHDAAWASGGQFISTDYIVPNPDFGTGYVAAVPGGTVARCNVVNAPTDCVSALIAP